MSTPQEYWDACVIKAWRNFGTFADACKMFHSITKAWPNECDPPLLRYPNGFLPNTVQMRYFVAHFLPKMNDWLWKYPADKDVELLRNVGKSKYTTLKKRDVGEDEKERNRLGAKSRKDKELRKYRTTMFSRANEDTDWNVTKAPGKYRTGRKK